MFTPTQNAVPTKHTKARRFSWKLATWSALGLCVSLAGCTPYAGVSVPVGPVSIGVGASNSGMSVGVGTGMGPVGVGVGVNQRGQVTGSAGVGASTHIGDSNARIGAGVGTSTTLYDPQSKQTPANVAPPVVQPRSDNAASPSNTTTVPAANGETVWRDAQGNAVPACKVRGQC